MLWEVVLNYILVGCPWKFNSWCTLWRRKRELPVPFSLRRGIQGKNWKEIFSSTVLALAILNLAETSPAAKSEGETDAFASYIESSNPIKSFFQETRAFRPKDWPWQDANNRHNQSYEHSFVQVVLCSKNKVVIKFTYFYKQIQLLFGSPVVLAISL